MLSQSDYTDFVNKYRAAYSYMCSLSAGTGIVASNIVTLRSKFECVNSSMYQTLIDAGFIFIEDENIRHLDKLFRFPELGLFDEKGNFLLRGRFIFPVRDLQGNILTLIGWFPDNKRYITAPSRFFSKSCLFYGMEQIQATGMNKDYFLVEGIFDSLALRALGFNAISMQGLQGTKYKQVLYGLFNRLIAIPDNDEGGRQVIAKDSWRIPSNGSYFYWRESVGGEYIKDVDDLATITDPEDLKEVFSSLWSERARNIKLV